jgi:hypothetical protein
LLKSVVLGVSVPIDLFFAKYDILRDVVAGMFSPLGKHRWKRVEIVMLLLRMSVYYQTKGYRQPFASAHWYAGNCFCSEKTVDRLVKWLKLQGFARVKRLRRRDTQALWVKQNKQGLTNESWHALAKEYGGARSPFKLYPDGFYSTNEIDLRPLLAKLMKLLGQALKLKVRGYRVCLSPEGLTFKAWFPVDPYFTKPPPGHVESFLALV